MKAALFLLATIAVAHLAYLAFPDELQARVFYIGRGLEGMGLFGIACAYGPRLALWALVCWWGYIEELQTAVCRIATFDQGPTHDSMLCVSLVGVHPYQILASCALAFLAIYLPKGQVWPRA